MKNNFTFRFIYLIAGISLCGSSAIAQTAEPSDSIPVEEVAVAQEEDEAITIPPLFEYVVAPDNLPDLQSRTDYLMDNFWNPFDFKKTKSVDQNALNHAFSVYVQAMPYASEKKVMDSVKKLVGNIKGNPGLSLQFVKAAEEVLYGPRAEFWADPIYMSFLENLLANKKVSDSKKKKYIAQLDLLKRNAVGATLPHINFVALDGKPSTMQFTAPYTLLQFRNVDCDDCKFANLKLELNGVASDMIDNSKLEVYSIVLTDDESAIRDFDAGEMNPKWHLGWSQDAATQLDIRMTPSYYLVDQNGKIVAKNEIISSVLDIISRLPETPQKTK